MGTGEGKHGDGNEINTTHKKGKKKEKIKWSRKKNKGLQWEEEQIKKLQGAYQNIATSKIQSFSDFPLSQKTLKGLKDSGYLKPTEIQRECIGLALQGADILGAAKTGSGKTLAFLIPVMEILYCKQWTRMDGLGALIITPTRELAYQIFETLRKVGRYHDISGGLIIGGKDLHFEKKRMDQCNVVICTPGRLLQHMDENPLFDCSNMQVLVLDEADRCLDMGFEATMNGIIENLPPKRQTLLFSATQTKSVRDLARLSLKDPMYVSVHEHAKHSTPESLQQSYVVCELHEKMDMLWSFIRNHLKQKILIFMSSCKQVKYHYEVFCRLRPGTSLLALYGTLHQLRRMAIYESFCRKSNAVLFATDIAARGLDFPEVNWVVQLDCPEDANTYIHRAGRTARYHKGGESLLVLLPSEETGMLEQLNTKKIPINKIKINPKKLQSPRRKIEALLARDPSLKESAQRAFVSYVKAVFLMKNKDVFNVHALNTDEYARSLGLAVPPRIRFLQKLQKQQQNTASQGEEPAPASEEDVEHTNSDDAQQHFQHGEDDSDSELDILKVKRRDHELEDEIPPPEEDSESQDDSSKKKKKKLLTKVAVAKKILKKKIVANKKVVFNEEGEMVVDPAKEKASSLAREYETENTGGIDIEKARQVLREEDKFDKQRFREKVKAKHREEKLKLKKAKEELKKKTEEEEQEDEEVRLGSEESSEESGPDLSWLPDPDKVYGDKQSSSCSDDEDQVHRPLPLKRKLSKDSKLLRKKHKQEESDEDAPIDTGLTLNEDEELALQFLKNR